MHRLTFSQSTGLKNRALYKASMFLLAFMLAFTSFIQTQQKAHANPLVLPGGIVVGTGVYVGAALATAGIAGAIGYDEYSEQINAHSKMVWETNTQAAKDSLTLSVKAAQGVGNAVVSLQSDFINFMEGKLQNIAVNTTNVVNASDPSYQASLTTNIYRYAGATSFANATYGSSYTAWASVDSFASGYGVIQNLTDGTVKKLTGSTHINIDTNKFYGAYGGVNFSVTNLTQSQWMAIRTRVYTGMDAAAIVALIADTTKLSLNYGALTVNNYPTINQRIRESWESMRDAGLVLPVDSAVPMSNAGEPLTYNPTTDVYTGIDGGVISHGDVSWRMPGVRWREQSDAIPTPGVYVDTPVLTGNPTYDNTLINNPAIPKTTTNVYTGTTVANPDMPAPPPTTPLPEPTPTPKPLPRVPGSGAPVPALILLAFFDLLRALLMYLVRMFNWIMTVPFVAEKPIDNEYFQWFRQAKILGVYPYALVTGMATFFLGFKLVKAVRSFLP